MKKYKIKLKLYHLIKMNILFLLKLKNNNNLRKIKIIINIETLMTSRIFKSKNSKINMLFLNKDFYLKYKNINHNKINN